MSGVVRSGIPSPVVLVVLWVGAAALCYAAIRDLFLVPRESGWTSFFLALAFICLAAVRTRSHLRQKKDGD